VTHNNFSKRLSVHPFACCKAESCNERCQAEGYHTNITENKYAKVTLLAATFYTFWKGTTPMKVPIEKLVLVISGTGAQGQVVVKALLESTSEWAPSPYTASRCNRERNHAMKSFSSFSNLVSC
jgi:hypothetical protein